MASLPEAFAAFADLFRAHRAVALTYGTGKVATVTPLTVTDRDGATFSPIDMLSGMHTYATNAPVGIVRTTSSRPIIFPLT